MAALYGAAHGGLELVAHVFLVVLEGVLVAFEPGRGGLAGQLAGDHAGGDAGAGDGMGQARRITHEQHVAHHQVFSQTTDGNGPAGAIEDLLAQQARLHQLTVQTIQGLLQVVLPAPVGTQAQVGQLALGEQPGVSARVLVGQPDVGIRVGLEQGHGVLAGLHHFQGCEAQLRGHRGMGAIGGNHHLVANLDLGVLAAHGGDVGVGVQGHQGRAGPELGAQALGLPCDGPVELGPVDHEPGKLGFMHRARGQDALHAGDAL